LKNGRTIIPSFFTKQRKNEYPRKKAENEQREERKELMNVERKKQKSCDLAVTIVV
jgi:hypothetical protein